jgi:predicted GIY-YIG superfamily endonuclease
VKERIFKYLLEAGRGVAADQILRDIFNIRAPNPHSADSVLAGFLGQDSKFMLTEGLWHLRPLSREPIRFDFGRAAVLHMKSPNRPGTLRYLRGAVRWADGRIQEFTAQASVNILSKLRSELDGHLAIVWSSREFQLWNRLLRLKGLEIWQGDKLYLQSFAARVLERKPLNLQPEDLASELGLSPVDEKRPRDVIRYLNACWLLLLDRVPAEFCRNLDSLRAWMEGPSTAVDFSHFVFGSAFLRRLPGVSGVYIMKDRKGTALYIGKSRNLKRRVSSYFTPRAIRQPKIARIHEQLRSIEVLRTDNEIEALLMEMHLIKDLRPAINLQTEIHERQAGRHEGRNLLLFVVDTEQNGVMIYFLRNGIFTGQYSALLGHPPPKRLQERIKSLFFGRGKGRKQAAEIWEKEIVFRWLAANQRRLNYLDVDEAESFAVVLEQLQHYLCDPDKLTRKVYYR